MSAASDLAEAVRAVVHRRIMYSECATDTTREEAREWHRDLRDALRAYDAEQAAGARPYTQQEIEQLEMDRAREIYASVDAEQEQAKPACACRGALKGDNIEHAELSCGTPAKPACGTCGGAGAFLPCPACAPPPDRERERFDMALSDYAIRLAACTASYSSELQRLREDARANVVALYDAARKARR